MNDNKYRLTAIQSCCGVAKPYACKLYRKMYRVGYNVDLVASINVGNRLHPEVARSGIEFKSDGKCPAMVKVAWRDKTALIGIKNINAWKDILDRCEML